MKGGSWSLRRRLMAYLATATVLVWAASSAWVYSAAMAETEELMDASLDHTGHALLAVVRNEVAELKETKNGLGVELVEFDHSSPVNMVYQVLGPNGGLVYRSHGAPTSKLGDLKDRGFRTVRVDGVEYRVFTLSMQLDAVTIHVAQRVDRRLDLTRASALRLVMPGIALLVALFLAVAFTVRRATAPVVRYAGALDRLGPGDEAPVDGSSLPSELQPVARAIDGLLARVRNALLRERTLTADAAHEMRNPLAALRLQAQVARRARDPAERDTALEELLGGVDRAARMVETILTLARFDAGSKAQLRTQVVDLDRLLVLLAREYRPLARERGLSIEAHTRDVNVFGDEDALAIAVRNLIGNALKYARTRIHVEVWDDIDAVSIQVLDDGPGFSEESASRAFSRFFRGTDDGAVEEGTGLGLALVLRIAEIHGGTARIVPGIAGGGGVALDLPHGGIGTRAGSKEEKDADTH